MKILLTGATGFVGKKLVGLLSSRGFECVLLSRNPAKGIRWNPIEEEVPLSAFDGVDVVINLLGEPVASGRWTKSKKKEIYSSRVVGTRNLLNSIRKLSKKPSLIISASATGIYGSDRSDELFENSNVGDDFLAHVCVDWEKEALTLSNEVRTVIFRIGVVLGDGGGALDKLLPIFKLGLGGPIASGKQFMSWIDLDDLISMMSYSIDSNISGIFNAVAPNPVTNKEFTKDLANTLSRPAIIPVPSFALKLAYGEMSEVLLGSQKVSSKKIQDTGFTFKSARLLSVMQRLYS